MRRAWHCLMYLVCGVLALSLPAAAADVAAPDVAEADAAAPTTKPAGTNLGGPFKVLVLPLADLSETPGQRDWLGRAMHASMLAELARLRFLEPIGPGSGIAPVTDNQAAIQAGKEANASYTVTGGYQMIEAELRVTGQVLDVGTGRVIGGFKATGAIRDLFGIEDIVAGQIRQQLVGEITGTPVDPAASMEPVLMEPAPEPPQESQEAADTQMVAEIPPYDTYGQMRSIYDVPLVSVYPPVLITPPYPPVWYGDDDDDDHDHDGNWDGRRSRFTPIGLRRRPGGGITHPNGVYVRGPRHVMRGGPSHVMRGGFGSVARPPTSSTR